jgi:hypothetical protein
MSALSNETLRRPGIVIVDIMKDNVSMIPLLSDNVGSELNSSLRYDLTST